MITIDEYNKYFELHPRGGDLRESKISKICWHCKTRLGTLDYIILSSLNEKRKATAKLVMTPILYFHEDCFKKIAGDAYFIEVPK